jgi:hypothetical protein
MMAASALETLPINKAKAIAARDAITSKIKRVVLDVVII